MKIVAAIILLFFCAKANAQTVVKIDSSVTAFKTYLEKNIRYPAVAAENDIQGQMVITFKLNSAQKINDIIFVKHLFDECDSVAVKAIRQYPNALLLPPATYTIGLKYMLHVEGKADSIIVPFDKSAYENFLFEVDLNRYFPKPQVHTILMS